MGIDALVLRERTRRLDGVLGEVEARNVRSPARPRQRVEAEVTLEMQEVATGDVTDLVELDGPQRALSGAEAVDVVELRCDVQWCALVPLQPVGFHRFDVSRTSSTVR